MGSINDKSVLREVTIDEKKWLLSQLTHRKSRIRWNAACELGKCQCKEGVDDLIIALQDKHWLVRLHAAVALGRIGDKKALEPLEESLQDNCPYVQRRVIVALGKLHDASVIPLILKVWQTDDRMFSYPVYQSLRNFMGQYEINALMKASRESAHLERMHKEKYQIIKKRQMPLVFNINLTDDIMRAFSRIAIGLGFLFFFFYFALKTDRLEFINALQTWYSWILQFIFFILAPFFLFPIFLIFVGLGGIAGGALVYIEKRAWIKNAVRVRVAIVDRKIEFDDYAETKEAYRKCELAVKHPCPTVNSTDNQIVWTKVSDSVYYKYKSQDFVYIFYDSQNPYLFIFEGE